MTNEYWLQAAKQLPEGKSERLQCCKFDKSMIISNASKGYSAYCFRCGYQDFRPHGERSISQIVKNKFELVFEQSKKISLPLDYVPITQAPDDALLWILEYGISVDLAEEYNIGYSPSMDRVILPVYTQDGKVLLHCQARALDGRKPKYLNQESPNANVIFWSRKQHPVHYPWYCVITEDILSTIKVGEVAPSACIMGTSMNAERANKIINNYDAVVIWMDNDFAGEKGRRECKRQLQLQGMTNIRHIKTMLDPKQYCLAHIRNELDKIDWNSP